MTSSFIDSLVYARIAGVLFAQAEYLRKGLVEALADLPEDHIVNFTHKNTIERTSYTEKAFSELYDKVHAELTAEYAEDDHPDESEADIHQTERKVFDRTQA